MSIGTAELSDLPIDCALKLRSVPTRTVKVQSDVVEPHFIDIQ
jgi:hypothetical protein